MDSIFGIHASALMLRGQRSGILAANLANADTPGFKARDFEFASALRSAERSSLRAERRGEPLRNARTDLGYRMPFQDSLDGNTVEADTEMARFAENSVAYQASLMFINSKIRGLRLAITGQR
jgi:flagellar basal-body rod protein FlgB